jgi:hypothetical protein
MNGHAENIRYIYSRSWDVLAAPVGKQTTGFSICVLRVEDRYDPTARAR